MDEVKTGDWRLTVFWIATALATGIAGFVLGWSWRDRPGALANVSLLNVMTAIGTVGSAVGAVGIAAWQYVSARREKYSEAAHAVGESYPRFIALAAALTTAKNVFESDVASKPHADDIRATIRMLQDEFVEARLPRPSQLIALGPPYSQGMAAIFSHLDPVFRLAEKDEMRTEEDRQATLIFVLNGINVAIPRLKTLGDLGYELMTGINARDAAAGKPPHVKPSDAR